MITEHDVQAELKRLAELDEYEAAARAKSYDMHGGDNPAPTEKPMPKIIAQFGDWAVTPFGVECLTYAFEIQWDSLVDPVTTDSFWLEKLSKKHFVTNLRDLSTAIRAGRQIHRYLQEENQ